MCVQCVSDPMCRAKGGVPGQFVIEDDAVLKDVSAGALVTLGKSGDDRVLIDMRESIAKLKVARIGGAPDCGLDPEALVLFGSGHQANGSIQVLVVVEQELQGEALDASLDVGIENDVTVQEAGAETINPGNAGASGNRVVTVSIAGVERHSCAVGIKDAIHSYRWQSTANVSLRDSVSIAPVEQRVGRRNADAIAETESGAELTSVGEGVGSGQETLRNIRGRDFIEDEVHSGQADILEKRVLQIE